MISIRTILKYTVMLPVVLVVQAFYQAREWLKQLLLGRGS